MALYILIPLSRQFKKEHFGDCWVYFNALLLIERPVSPKFSKPKGVVLSICLVCIKGVICYFNRVIP